MAIKSKAAKRAPVKKPALKTSARKPASRPAPRKHSIKVSAFSRTKDGWKKLEGAQQEAAMQRLYENLANPWNGVLPGFLGQGIASGESRPAIDATAHAADVAQVEPVGPVGYKAALPTGLAGSILREAANIVEGSREQTHGPKERSFIAIAGAWNAYLAARRDPTAPITATDVCWMMNWMKTVRSVQGEFVRDHAVDAAGYAAIAGEVGLAI